MKGVISKYFLLLLMQNKYYSSLEEFSFADLIELKHTIEETLSITEDKLLIYSVSDDDEYDFAIKKAISYRDILKKVNVEISKRLKS